MTTIDHSFTVATLIKDLRHARANAQYWHQAYRLAMSKKPIARSVCDDWLTCPPYASDGWAPHDVDDTEEHS